MKNILVTKTGEKIELDFGFRVCWWTGITGIVRSTVTTFHTDDVKQHSASLKNISLILNVVTEMKIVWYMFISYVFPITDSLFTKVAGPTHLKNLNKIN